jgi:predicted RNase H-like HicB family nuclease
MALTAAYISDRPHGYTVEILEATGVYTQGDTVDEARENLYSVVELMLEEAPHQFGIRAEPVPLGAFIEKLYVLVPA